MESRLLTAAVFATAAITVGAFASPTEAKTYTYTFGTGSGGAYCDGITFTNGGSGDIWSGVLLGSCGNDQSVSGFTVKGETTTTIELSSASSAEPGVLEVFLIQPKTLLWYLYVNDGSGLELANEGPLIKGAPPIGTRRGKSSLFKNPKAVDNPTL